jgi:hydrogenase/urease accessory protein HupE
MALPQTIDPASLNLSGIPAIATEPTTTTSVGATGMPNARVENVNRPVNPALGALFGGLLGYATGQNLGSGATGLTPINKPPTGTGIRIR